MLLKLIGSALVLTASSFLGYLFSRECARRPQELRALQGLLQMLENEISFLSNILTEAFDRIYRSSNCGSAQFFRDTVINLNTNRGLNAAQAWEKAVDNNIQKTSMDREDREILISFGKMLGNSDVEGQIKNIRLTINQLKLQEQKAEESRRKNEAMYRSLGILGGMAIIIILL